MLGVKTLAVSDAAVGVILYNASGDVKHILSTNAYGVAYDSDGHLYVAEYGAVVQYRSDSSKRAQFRYTKGLGETYAVATDSMRHVYVISQLNRSTNPTVTEYAQLRNRIVNQCQIEGTPPGNVVVGAKGDILVSATAFGSSSGAVFRFAGGLSGCNRTTLPVTFHSPFGLAIDRRTHDLLVGDLSGQYYVDVLKPPYTSINQRLPGLAGVSLALNNDTKNRLLFTIPPGFRRYGDQVTVAEYPSGEYYTTLTNGLSEPSGVASR